MGNSQAWFYGGFPYGLSSGLIGLFPTQSRNDFRGRLAVSIISHVPLRERKCATSKSKKIYYMFKPPLRSFLLFIVLLAQGAHLNILQYPPQIQPSHTTRFLSIPHFIKQQSCNQASSFFSLSIIWHGCSLVCHVFSYLPYKKIRAPA